MSKIITAQQLKDIKPEANDTLAALVADAVNAWIENATSRCWGELKTVTELQDASGVVWLDHMDVQDVVSIKSGNPGSDRRPFGTAPYRFNRQGRLILSYGRQYSLSPSTLDQIEVEYTYGVPEEDVPADLILAALGIATGYYEYVSNGAREVSRAQVGSYTVQYAASGSDTPDTAGNKVTRDTQVVNSYALRRI